MVTSTDADPAPGTLSNSNRVGDFSLQVRKLFSRGVNSHSAGIRI
jgi:hypothetical protein